LGRVLAEENEPTFHSDWERRVFGLLWATFGTGKYTVDEFRRGIERMHPADYMTSRYYEHWLHTIERTLVAKGYITDEEVEAKTRYYLENPDAAVPRREGSQAAEAMAKLAWVGAPTRREVEVKPRFKVGDRVVTRNLHPTGHTRLARPTDLARTLSTVTRSVSMRGSSGETRPNRTRWCISTCGRAIFSRHEGCPRKG
jgi:nitrile hydratase